MFCHQNLATSLREHTATRSLDHCREISPEAKISTNVIDIFVIVRDTDCCQLIQEGSFFFVLG